MHEVPVLAGIDGNYTVQQNASSGVGEVCRSGEPPPQHNSVCVFLNNLRFLFFNSFVNNLWHDYVGGVPSYIPKKGSLFDAVCIDHFVGSANVICKAHSITQCCELSHAQVADDHIPIAGMFQFPLARSSTAPQADPGISSNLVIAPGVSELSPDQLPDPNSPDVFELLGGFLKDLF